MLHSLSCLYYNVYVALIIIWFYLQIHAQTVLMCTKCYDEKYVIFPYIATALKALWADGGVRRAVSRGYEYELNDSAI